MTVKRIKRGLAIVNLTVSLATLISTGNLDRTTVFYGSSKIRSASRLVKLADN